MINFQKYKRNKHPYTKIELSTAHRGRYRQREHVAGSLKGN
jgi:hypothetical protein